MIEGYKVLIRQKDKKKTQSYGNTYNQYDLASVTKVIVGIRVLQMIDENIIDLNDPIYHYIPEFKNKRITIEDALMHRTGFKASSSQRYVLKGQELLADILSASDLMIEHHGSVLYSCLNFIVLGELIKRIDGSLESSLKKHIFNPLNMCDTGFNPVEKSNTAPTEIHATRGLIKGVVHDSTAYNLGGISGNAGLFSSLEDLEKLFDSLVEDEKILTNKMKNKIQETNVGGRSLAFNLSEENELYHTGFTGPLVMINFSEVKYMILLTNRTYPDRGNHEYLQKREQLIEDFSKGVVDTKILFDMIYP